MSKTTMTVLAAVAAVVAVLALGVAIGFAVDSDDVGVAAEALPDEIDETVDDDNGNPAPDSGDEFDDDSPEEIEGFGDLFECLQDAGLGLEDLEEFDMDLGQLFEVCIGGLLGQSFSEEFNGEEFGPFEGLEKFFEEGGDGGLGGFEEFFEQFEDGFEGFTEQFSEEDFPFDREGLEDFFGDFFNEESDTGA